MLMQNSHNLYVLCMCRECKGKEGGVAYKMRGGAGLLSDVREVPQHKACIQDGYARYYRYYVCTCTSMHVAGVKKKVYGCSLPGQEREGAESAEPSYPHEAEGFMFAPTDVTPWEAEGKDDVHGIGYRGMQEQHVLGARKATKALYGMSGEVSVVCMGLGAGACTGGQKGHEGMSGEVGVVMVVRWAWLAWEWVQEQHVIGTRKATVRHVWRGECSGWVRHA